MSLKSLRLAALAVGLTSCSSWAQTVDILHHFNPATSGTRTESALTLGPDGAMYGTATEGGLNNAGTLFKVTTDGTFSVEAHFTPATTGTRPHAQLLNVGDGNLYGATFFTTNIAGSPPGVVYRFTPGEGLSTVFALTGQGTSPQNPIALVSGETDVLHVLCEDYAGVWRVPLDGSTRTISYSVTDGSFPASIVRGTDGFLYGTSRGGGANSVGTLFRLNADGSNLTVLYSCSRTDKRGIQPRGPMVQAPDGNFYGTMSDGGPHNGVIFRLTPAGQYTVIHSFDDLRYPYGGMILASDGYLYGTALNGTKGTGGIFRIKPNGTGYKAVYQFASKNTEPFYPEGREPEGGLVQGADGNLYGTTVRGGNNAKGVVFRLRLKLPPPPINRSPIAIDDTIFSNGNGAVSVNVKGNDYDPDNDPLTVKVVSNPSHGTAVVQTATGAIIYTPNGSYDGSDSFTYRVTDGRGGSSLAIVVVTENATLPALKAGGYTGVLTLPQQSAIDFKPRAQITLTVTPTGKFTGTLNAQRKRFNFKGTFATNGTAAVKLKLPVLGESVMYLGYEFSPSPVGQLPAVQATIVGKTGLTWEGGAVIHLPGDNVKKTFTVALGNDLANLNAPVGHGYGAMTVLPTGVVTVKGKLADGSALSWSTHLVGVNGVLRAVPFFSEPLAGGTIAGSLTQTGNLDSGFEGRAFWNRAAGSSETRPYGKGFETLIDLRADLFTPPAKTAPVLSIPTGEIELSGGPVANPVAGSYTLNGTRVTVTAPLSSFTINRTTGVFTGRMTINRKPVTFTGVVNQGDSTGYGYALIGGISTAVTISR